MKRIAGIGRWAASAGVVLLATALTGCDGFFVKPGTTSGSGSSGTSGSYAYATNNGASSTSLSIYALASGTLVPAATATFSLGFVPSALAMRPGNTFLYVANSSTGTIYAYTVGSTGALTIANGGLAVAGAINATSMDISADGQWLFALDAGGTTLAEYKITNGSGALAIVSSLTFAGIAVTPSSVRVAPSGAFVVCALGTAGDIIFPFNTSTGAINPSYTSIGTGSSSVGDYSAAFDNGNFLYVARSSGIMVYSVSSAGVPTQVSGSPFPAGTGPRSVVLNNGFLYAANQGSGTISAYSISGTGALTALAGSPTGGPSTVTALAIDSTGKYLLALGYSGTAGLTMYSIGSGGALSSTGSVPTGTTLSVPAVLALTR